MEAAFAVSWWAIIIAALVKFAIGAVWFTALFGARYRALTGVPEGSSQEGLVPAMVVQIVGDLIMAYILARFIVHYGDPTLMSGIIVGFMAWLGFVATIGVGTIFYEKKTSEFVAITAGYQLVGIVVMGAIIGWWH
jgi:hypothetical protein